MAFGIILLVLSIVMFVVNSVDDNYEANWLSAIGILAATMLIAMNA